MPQFWPPPPRRILSGFATAVGTSWKTVAFPAGYFTAAPAVVAMPVSVFAKITINGASASGFDVAVDAGTATVYWIAVQS